MADMDTVDISEPRDHDSRRSRSQSQQQKPVKTGTWLQAEDVRLRNAVARYGTRWVRVAGEVGSRNGDQCAKRWNENLNPDLDHSPWTQEEDEHLLTMVKSYGHNWKFMADSFLEMRAPLALKNRYSLLMRRLNRQSNGQQQANGAETSRQAAFSIPSSGAATPTSLNNTVDLTNFFGSGRGPQGQSPDYTVINIASSNFAPSTDPYDTGIIPPGDITAADIQRGAQSGGGNAPWTPTTTAVPAPWDDLDLLIDRPPPSFPGGRMEPDGVDNELEKMAVTPDPGTGSQPFPNCGGGSSATLSDGGNNGPSEVEYTVTCQRGKIKTLMNHLVDAAMSESAEWTVEDSQVTVSLRLKA